MSDKTLRELIEHERMIRHVAIARGKTDDVIELRDAMDAVDAYCQQAPEQERLAAIGRMVDEMRRGDELYVSMDDTGGKRHYYYHNFATATLTHGETAAEALGVEVKP